MIATIRSLYSILIYYFGLKSVPSDWGAFASYSTLLLAHTRCRKWQKRQIAVFTGNLAVLIAYFVLSIHNLGVSIKNLVVSIENLAVSIENLVVSIRNLGLSIENLAL